MIPEIINAAVSARVATRRLAVFLSQEGTELPFFEFFDFIRT
jgi:hypothetical protein